MAIQTVANLKIFINANIKTNGVNSITGKNHNTILIDIVDSFFSVLSTPAVLGSGTANKITRWATNDTVQAGTWTQTSDDLVPDTNNSKLGSDTLGVQAFFSAATTTSAPANFKSSAGTIPTGTNRKAGMFFFDGTNLFFHLTDNAPATNLLAAHPVISNNIIPVGNGSSVVDGTWEFDTNDLIPTTNNSSIGKTGNAIELITGKNFILGELPSDTGALYFASQNHFNINDYMLFQDNTTGTVFMNGKGSVNFTVDNENTLIRLTPSVLHLASGDNSYTVEVGNGIATLTDAKVNIVGETNDNTKSVLDMAGTNETLLYRFRNDGHAGIGGITSPTAWMHLAASTTSEASLRIADGTAPTSPNDGDLWSESGVPKVRTNGVTKDLGGGAKLAGLPTSYIHDIATADVDPGAGNQRFDSVVYASIGNIFVDNLSSNNNDLSALYLSRQVGDFVFVQQADDATKGVGLQINADLIDASGYFKIPVDFIGEGTGGNIDDGAQVVIIFFKSDISNGVFNNVIVNGQANSPYDVLADATAIATDCNNGNNHKLTLTTNGPYTLSNPTNLKDGASYLWRFQQDATGTRLISTYGSVFKFAGGSAPILSTDANAVDIISGICDGTDIICSILKDVK